MFMSDNSNIYFLSKGAFIICLIFLILFVMLAYSVFTTVVSLDGLVFFSAFFIISILGTLYFGRFVLINDRGIRSWNRSFLWNDITKIDTENDDLIIHSNNLMTIRVSYHIDSFALIINKLKERGFQIPNSEIADHFNDKPNLIYVYGFIYSLIFVVSALTIFEFNYTSSTIGFVLGLLGIIISGLKVTAGRVELRGDQLIIHSFLKANVYLYDDINDVDLVHEGSDSHVIIKLNNKKKINVQNFSKDCQFLYHNLKSKLDSHQNKL